MLDLVLEGGAVAVLSAYYYDRKARMIRRSLQQLAYAATGELEERKDKRELETKCKHTQWSEVLGLKSGELLALLCLQCQTALYLDEGYGVYLEDGEELFKPSGCTCRPAEEVYSTLCPLSHHSGKAKLLAAIKAAETAKQVEAAMAAKTANQERQAKQRAVLAEEFDWRWKRLISQPLTPLAEALTPYRSTEYSSGAHTHQHTSDSVCLCEDCINEQAKCTHCSWAWDRAFAATRDLYANGQCSWGEVENRFRREVRNLVNLHAYHYDQRCTECEPLIRRGEAAVSVLKDRRHFTSDQINLFNKALGVVWTTRHDSGKHLGSDYAYMLWLDKIEALAARPPLTQSQASAYRADSASVPVMYWSEGRKRQEAARQDLVTFFNAATKERYASFKELNQAISRNQRAAGGIVQSDAISAYVSKDQVASFKELNEALGDVLKGFKWHDGR